MVGSSQKCSSPRRSRCSVPATPDRARVSPRPRGDIILEAMGQPITSVEQLDGMVSAMEPGQRLSLLAVDTGTGQVGRVTVALW